MKASRGVVIVILGAAILLGSACSKSATTTATSATPAAASSGDFTGNPDSPYCRAALQWAVVEMTPRDGTPPVEEKYWTDYAAFLKHGDDIAPSEIKSAFDVYKANGINTVLPLLRKYGFDKDRFERDATGAEKKAVEGNPPAVDQAFGQILKYEWQVCGNGTPDMANVKYSGEKESAYCKSQKEAVAAFAKIPDSGFSPDVVKAFFTGKTFTETVAKSESLAPEAIKSDVAANVNWIRTKQLPVIAKYGYDFKKIKLQATAAERFAADTSAVEIRDVERRLNAYDSQVCGL